MTEGRNAAVTIRIIAGTPARRNALEHAVRLGTGRDVEIETRDSSYVRERHAELSDIIRGQSDQEIDTEPTEPTVVVMDHQTVRPPRSVPETSDVTVPALRATRGNAVVVVVDRSETDFDAEHVFGDSRSPADLCVRTEQLAASRMWSGRETDGAGVPAYCPELLRWAERRGAQTRELKRHPDATSLEILGLSHGRPPLRKALTRGQHAALCPHSTSLATVRWTETYETACQELTWLQRRTIRASSYRQDPWVLQASRRAMIWAAAATLDRWVRLELLPVGRPVMGLRQVIVQHPWIVKRKGTDSLAEAANRALRAGAEGDAIDAETWNDGRAAARIDGGPWYPEPVFETEAVINLKDVRNGPGNERPPERLVHCAATDHFEVLRRRQGYFTIRPETEGANQSPRAVVRTPGMWPACRVEANKG